MTHHDKPDSAETGAAGDVALEVTILEQAYSAIVTNAAGLHLPEKTTIQTHVLVSRPITETCQVLAMIDDVMAKQSVP